MTDLERAIKVTLSAYFGPEVSTGDLRKSIMRVFDAHLKEDAEREQEYALLDATIRRVEAENARLRERVKELEAYASAMRGSDI